MTCYLLHLEVNKAHKQNVALKKDQIATFQNKGTDTVIVVKSFNTLNFDKTDLVF